MYINTFKYTPKDVSCQLCTEYVKKLGCTALRCPWLAERIEAGVVGYREAVLETFPHERRLFQRLNLLIKHYPGSLWSNEQHERRMQYQCAVQGYADMFTIAANVFGEDFSQSFTVALDFVPMMHQTNKDEVFIAEKTTFDSLVTFLRTEFYRGLAAGNAPRRCHNCGTYFLLDSGYNAIYCNNIAPGETDRTCRKVGAHRKEAQGKENRSPARVEYDRAYNRLKQKKNRKKISLNEWNAAVAEAMRILVQSERSELTDDEMRARFKAL